MSNVVALPTRALQVVISISDPEVLHEVERREDGAAREAFVNQALRLGVLAVRQASGALDADVIRREGDQLLATVGSLLQNRTSALSESVTKLVLQYLDPASGSLPQRIDQLTKPDGDLESLLGRHFKGDQSTIAQTLAKHVGEQSPLFKLLSPKQSDGLLAALTESLKRALDGQRDDVLKQFSLDRKDSALSRLLTEVTSSNGKLRLELAEDVEKMVNEFSLDNEEGALSRLVQRVERAQTTIAEEFSLDHQGSALQRLAAMLTQTNAAVESSLTLDNDASPLARLKREILEVLTQHKHANAEFQTEVRSTLETFKARREEAARSTRHGLTFEDQVGEQLAHEAKRTADVLEHVGLVNGKLPRKVGDYVLELGPESASPGARIVFEAKAKKSYTLKAALTELAEARKNRDAEVGVCVIDRASAPAQMEPLHRVGCDVLVVWDAEDVATDVYLKVAFGLARSLAHRERAARSRADADFLALDAAIEEIAGHLSALESIESSATTVRKSGEKIAKGAQAIREALERQIDGMRQLVSAARTSESTGS